MLTHIFLETYTEGVRKKDEDKKITGTTRIRVMLLKQEELQ